MTAGGTNLLAAKGMEKSFAGVRALKGVSLKLRAGEVLAVIGENGAGKSTLMKILAGVQRADAGELTVQGQPLHARTVQDAIDAGVALIHQELNLAGNLDVGANIFLGQEPRKGGVIDNRAIRRNSIDLLRQVGLDVDPAARVDSLSIGKRQLVEIAKALSLEARILIMDEPTSSLSRAETERLFEVIRTLRDRGVGVIYISHRLTEVETIADRVHVLRDGATAGELDRDSITHDAMVRLMIGRDVSRFYAQRQPRTGHAALQATHIRTAAFPGQVVNLRIDKGEIVALAGLVGAGRTELLETIFGLATPLDGHVTINDQKLTPHTVRVAVRAGVALIPEDRQAHGLLLEDSVRDNLALCALARRRLWRGRAAERTLTASLIDQLAVKTAGDRQIVQTLSGGNQQKIVLGKWLAVEPRVLLLDEPTRGVDVGAKSEIYRIMERLAGEGLAILFASSDLEEVLGMADRVLVMRDGAVAGELDRDAMSEESIMRLAALDARVTEGAA